MLKIKTPLVDAYYTKISLTEGKLFKDRVISKEKNVSEVYPLDNILPHNNFNRFEHRRQKKVCAYIS